MAVTAADVKKLREITGAGMMDTKKALEESNGDFDKAIEYLRKKGQKLSDKRADREANEGVVTATINDGATEGVVVRLSCETDFVAKNQDYIDFTTKIADEALQNSSNSIEEVLSLPYEKITVGEKIVEQVGVIGEKIELSGYGKLDSAMVVSYIHMGNKAAVILGLNKQGDFEEAGKNVAMQVAAMKPIAVDKDEVDASVIEKEIEIGKEQARAEGKPEELLEKIAMGKLNKFYKERTLLNQQYVKDSSMDVKSYLKSVDPELTVTGFVHISL